MPKKSTVHVAIRTRPTASFAQDQLIVDQERGTIRVNERGGKSPSHSGGTSVDYLNNKTDEWNFAFHHVLHNAGQETVFEILSRETVAQCLEGINGTIMAYGQTGAGKTFTMIGDVSQYKYRGIAPRALGLIFSEIASRPQVNFQVTVTYMEIYNERIYDLLDDDGSKGAKEYAIVEDSKGGRGVHVRGLQELEVNSEEEALVLLMRGGTNRTTAEHQLNKSSNRSHCIFTVNIRQTGRLSQGTVLKSKLNLVDLAGSERLKKTLALQKNATGAERKSNEMTKKESMYINKSLTYLEQCVVALSSKHRSHVPYRQTKLTNVLKDSLGGNCNTLMVACIWGESRHLEETISTLKLAQRMMRVQNQAVVNEEKDPVALTKKYQRQILEMRQELMMHDALVGRSGVIYDEYTPEQQHEVAKMVRSYLDATPDEEDGVLKVESMRQVREIFKQFKLIVTNVESEVEQKLRKQFTFEAKSRLDGEPRPTVKSEDVSDKGVSVEGESANDLVGTIEDEGGYALGTAPAGARPATISGKDAGARSPAKSSPKAPNTVAVAPPSSPNDRNRLFEVFKATEEGGEVQEWLSLLSEKVRSLTARKKELRLRRNEIARAIKSTQRMYDARRAASLAISDGGEEEFVDEEEWRLLVDLKAQKKEFRDIVAAAHEVQAALNPALDKYGTIKERMVSTFNAWLSTESDDVRAPENDEDVLDDGEMFEKMEIERVLSEDPRSLAFVMAQKQQRKYTRSGRGGRGRKRRANKH